MPSPVRSRDVSLISPGSTEKYTTPSSPSCDRLLVVYSRDMLKAMGIADEIVRQHGMVSQESATAMAQTVRERLGADFGIGLSGTPGPSELEGKPLGLAFLAISGATGVKELEMRLPPRQITVKRRVSNTALIELRRLLTATATQSRGCGKPQADVG